MLTAARNAGNLTEGVGVDVNFNIYTLIAAGTIADGDVIDVYITDSTDIDGEQIAGSYTGTLGSVTYNAPILDEA